MKKTLRSQSGKSMKLVKLYLPETLADSLRLLAKSEGVKWSQTIERLLLEALACRTLTTQETAMENQMMGREEAL